MWALALFPFAQENRYNRPDTWHIVVFDKWFDTGIVVKNRKFKTYIAWDDNTISFCRDWGKPNTSDAGTMALEHPEQFPYADFYYWTCWHLPTYRVLYRKYYIKDGKWKLNSFAGRTAKSFDKAMEQEEEQDTYETTFHFYENGETGETILNKPKKKDADKFKRVIVKVKVTGAKRLYCWHWLPQWLPIFPHVIEDVWISLSEDIGRKRGSWKGGMIGRQYPFTKSLKESWNNFEYLELPKYFNGEK